MSKQIFISRFSYIIKRLELGPATYEQIADYLDKESALQDKNLGLSIRTLQRDIRDINEQMNIEISNEKKGEKRYYIKSRPEDGQHGQRLLEAYDMIHILKASQENSRYIFFEPRQPKGLEHFIGLLHACRNRKVTTFSYHKYWDDTDSLRTVHPLSLKEARGRWYLVAIDTKDAVLKTFGLDRINDLDISKTSFREKYAINLLEVFENSFGIINDLKGKPQQVILSLSYEQGQYLKAYPLHHSQKVSEGDEGTVIELHLLITYDLVMELLSYGDQLKVLQPKKLVKEIAGIAERMREKYA